MSTQAVTLIPVETLDHRVAAETLDSEYLRWVGSIAQAEYGLSFDVDAMVRSDIDDPTKFYPPNGRFYLIQYSGSFVGIGCLKRLAPEIGEVQRMYVQQHVRGVGAGRALVEQLMADARSLGLRTLRLESLRALTAAHSLYRSVGFAEIQPYATNSMGAYQEATKLGQYQQSAVFMEAHLDIKAH